MMQRCVGIVVLALILSACGGTTAGTDTTTAPVTTTEATTVAVTTPPQATEEPAAANAPTEAPATTEATEATEATVEAAAPAAVTYTIVPEESQVRYEVGEVFLNQDDRYAIAIGTTQAISGAITLDQTTPSNSTVGPITIDISTLVSDSPRRDNAIRDRWLESGLYPSALFTPTEISGLPERYNPGDELAFTMTGDLTVRETTQSVTFDVTASVVNDNLVGSATTQILMSSFGFEPPNIFNVLTVEDETTIALDFVARPE